jgi:anti-sigma regulatory factor (Ser/Thr protein kinase)
VHEVILDLRGSDPHVLPGIRRRIMAELAELGRPHLADVVQVADELATNAYEHGDGPHVIHVRHDRGACQTTVAVEDSNQSRLTLGESRFGETAHRGRGLLLVDQIADAWGVHDSTADRRTKTVWARISCAANPCARGGDVN